MSAIVKAVLTGTLGLLLKKSRQSLAEKLKNGDATDQQLRSWIIEEFDNVNSKLDALSRKDLKASLSFFKERVVFLPINKVMDSEASAVETSMGKSAEKMELSASAGVITTSLVEGLRKLHSTNLDESAKRALFDAKKRFDDARREATKAFNNDNLTPLERILAIGIRLMATILEKTENPADSLAACRSGLEELHSTPFVRENFKVELTGGVKARLNSDERRKIILLVCRVNRIIHDVSVIVGEIGMLFNWPCIEIVNERVDPLRDSRLGEALSKLEMGDCSVTWSVATEVISVATNSCGQFIVVDQDDRCAVLDAMGTFLYSFGLPAEVLTGYLPYMIRAVATDNDDNIYLCVETNADNLWGRGFQICVFKNHARAHFSHRFFVRNFEAVAVMVVGDHVIVPGRTLSSPSPCVQQNDYIVVYKRNGTLVGYISDQKLKCIQGITAVDDSRIMVLDKSSSVLVFAEVTGDYGFDHLQNLCASCLLQDFSVTHKAHAIAFHPATEHVIIVSQTTQERSQVLLYSKNGDFERGIDIALEEEDLMAAVMTADGRICVATNSKVLVL